MAAGEVVQCWLMRLVQRVWREERMTENWSVGELITLHKKDDRLKCDKYRAICFLSVGYKILAKVIGNRLEQHYTASVGEYQAGFKPGKSTVDQLFSVRQLAEKY